uniref:Uncharacterized protein n=1 Tax=viral metagenome TaxID=1070528 RepID=A0A6H1ZLY5_9ZZZZ
MQNNDRITISQAQSMIEEINKKGTNINDWEAGFLRSLSNQLSESRNVSEKQEDILLQMFYRL